MHHSPPLDHNCSLTDVIRSKNPDKFKAPLALRCFSPAAACGDRPPTRLALTYNLLRARLRTSNLRGQKGCIYASHAPASSWLSNISNLCASDMFSLHGASNRANVGALTCTKAIRIQFLCTWCKQQSQHWRPNKCNVHERLFSHIFCQQWAPPSRVL